MTPQQWASYQANGGSIDEDGNLEIISGMEQYISEYVCNDRYMLMSISNRYNSANNSTTPIIGYVNAEEALQLIGYGGSGVIKNAIGKMPIVISPYISISAEDIYEWRGKWGEGGNTYGLAASLSRTKRGTIVKTITTANPQKVFTSQELANMFGSGTGTYTAYVMNGDHAAQGADIIATYIQSGEVYVRFNATPTAGAYRFNYMISRF
jgi:hypothetical protein